MTQNARMHCEKWGNPKTMCNERSDSGKPGADTTISPHLLQGCPQMFLRQSAFLHNDRLYQIKKVAYKDNPHCANRNENPQQFGFNCLA